MYVLDAWLKISVVNMRSVNNFVCVLCMSFIIEVQLSGLLLFIKFNNQACLKNRPNACVFYLTLQKKR